MSITSQHCCYSRKCKSGGNTVSELTDLGFESIPPAHVARMLTISRRSGVGAGEEPQCRIPLAKIFWTKLVRFGQIWLIWCGQNQILHPQKQSISYGNVEAVDKTYQNTSNIEFVWTEHFQPVSYHANSNIVLNERLSSSWGTCLTKASHQRYNDAQSNCKSNPRIRKFPSNPTFNQLSYTTAFNAMPTVSTGSIGVFDPDWIMTQRESVTCEASKLSFSTFDAQLQNFVNPPVAQISATYLINCTVPHPSLSSDGQLLGAFFGILDLWLMTLGCGRLVLLDLFWRMGSGEAEKLNGYLTGKLHQRSNNSRHGTPRAQVETVEKEVRKFLLRMIIASAGFARHAASGNFLIKNWSFFPISGKNRSFLGNKSVSQKTHVGAQTLWYFPKASYGKSSLRQ